MAAPTALRTLARHAVRRPAPSTRLASVASAASASSSSPWSASLPPPSAAAASFASSSSASFFASSSSGGGSSTSVWPSSRAYSLYAPTPTSTRPLDPSFAAAASSSTEPALDRPNVVPPDRAAVHALAEADGMDEPEWIPEEEAFVYVTPSAWNRLAKIGSRERAVSDGSGMLWFRVAVDSGGCHGYQYKMDLCAQPNVDDYTLNPPSSLPPSLRPLPIVIDPASMAMLKGATVDFTTELIGSAFRVRENPQAKGSGCGCGVSWEAK